MHYVAAGNFNNGSANNIGSNGYVWSSSLYSSNPNNAYNMNFNSSNINPTNNNNRYNGFSVRGVFKHLFMYCYNLSKFILKMTYRLTKTQLLEDLYYAFECAKRHKANKPYVKRFEENLGNNLISLCNDLLNGTYRPEPSTCFIITHPKRREVFAANFRDRIVHHLYYNYTHELFERTFIHDTYSCIKKRGTHFGIHRLEKHIRQASNNYQETCYVLKMDIKGYFMSIDRNVLLTIVTNTLDKMKYHKLSKTDKTTWNDILDFKFIQYLSKEIILLDPTVDCSFKSKKEEWNELPQSKSLFFSNKHCGLPIGNLTSQLFSNVYLNVLDQFVKRSLKVNHYGRYVDDFYLVCNDRIALKQYAKQIEQFLVNSLHLFINHGKTKISTYRHGVEFLGAYIKPYRTYISNQCLRRIHKKTVSRNCAVSPFNSINSYLGIFSHYSTYNLRHKWFSHLNWVTRYGKFNLNYTKFLLVT